MNLESFLKVYGLMNFSIFVSHFSMRMCRQGVPLLRLRMAQILLLISIIAPVILVSLPEETLPSLKFPEIPKSSLTQVQNLLPHIVTLSPLLNTAALPTMKTQVNPFEMLKNHWAMGLIIIFLVGFTYVFAKLLKNLLRLRLLISSALPLRILGRVRIRLSDAVDIPFSTIVSGQAEVIVPLRMLQHETDFRIAIRHELQHHRQGDTLWALGVEFLHCFFFANPFFHFWKQSIQELQEFSCDEALTGRRGISSHEYGLCLLRVAEAAIEFRPIHAGTAWMAASSEGSLKLKSQLRRRIEMFMTKHNGRRGIEVLIGMLAIILTITAAYAANKITHKSELARVNPGTVAYNPEVQLIAERALKEGLDKVKARSGFAVVSEPDTGRVIAVAEFSKDPTRSKGWALSELVEPASATKPLVIALALKNGKTKLNTVYDCANGNYNYGGHLFHDHRSFDKLTAADTIVQSSNICGLRVAETMKAKDIASGFRDLGFGADGSSSEFPTARIGKLPSSRLSNEEQTAVYATGYSEMLSTPLEMLQAYGAIANGGRLMKPIQFTDGDDKIKVVRQVMTESIARDLRDTLRRVTTEGTAKWIGKLSYTMAGKTSTAYTPDQKSYSRLGGHSSTGTFIGFAPAVNPRVAIYVVVNDPADEEPVGGRHASPIFGRIAEEVLHRMGIAPDNSPIM